MVFSMRNGNAAGEVRANDTRSVTSVCKMAILVEFDSSGVIQRLCQPRRGNCSHARETGRRKVEGGVVVVVLGVNVEEEEIITMRSAS